MVMDYILLLIIVKTPIPRVPYRLSKSEKAYKGYSYSIY